MNGGTPYFAYTDYFHARLTEDEQRLVSVLTRVVEKIAGLYSQQRDKHYPQGKFYPHDATKQEVGQAAESDPEILSHFTVVKRSHDEGKLVAIPYRIHFHRQLTVIAKYLENALVLTQDEELKKILRAQLQALQEDSYEDALLAWVCADLSNVCFCLGPMEPYEDRFFYRKYGYQAWTGVINEELTVRCEQIKNAVVKIRRTNAFPSEKIEFLEKTRVRVVDTIAAGGLMTDYRFSAETLPNRPDMIAKFGTRTVIHTPQINHTFETKHLPTFNAIFERKFRDGFSKESLHRAYLYLVFLHEFARFLTRYKNAQGRLQELYPVLNEMVVEVFAVRLASALLLKDIITDKEFEAMLVIFLCRTLDGYTGSTRSDALSAFLNNEIDAYVAGNVLMLNNLLNSGSIRHYGGISWLNFHKVFLEIEHMIEPVERIFAQGSYQDARVFIGQHGTLEGIREMSPYIERGIPKRIRYG